MVGTCECLGKWESCGGMGSQGVRREGGWKLSTLPTCVTQRRGSERQVSSAGKYLVGRCVLRVLEIKPLGSIARRCPRVLEAAPEEHEGGKDGLHATAALSSRPRQKNGKTAEKPSIIEFHGFAFTHPRGAQPDWTGIWRERSEQTFLPRVLH